MSIFNKGADYEISGAMIGTGDGNSGTLVPIPAVIHFGFEDEEDETKHYSYVRPDMPSATFTFQAPPEMIAFFERMVRRWDLRRMIAPKPYHFRLVSDDVTVYIYKPRAALVRVGVGVHRLSRASSH